MYGLAYITCMIRLRIREVRQLRGLTQAELAERADVRRATVSQLERGESKAVYFDVLDRLARALDIAPALLIEETPDHA